MKELLSREGVPFTARNVEVDLDAYKELLDRGFRTVPVTVIGDRAIVGFNEGAIREALKPPPAAPQ